ncbi:peroxidase 3-like [Andrographis paniculata]|uniref:peroxidase 3-like n=1 Tax=Andrographis paniculata TaxID=175694 RepID=UPI0021E7301A|nr:peroxidase 3-like [Andrographis paniculata]
MSDLKPSMVFFLLFILLSVDAHKLSLDFYSKTCPSLAKIVRDTTARYISIAPSLAPALLRLHFHDCFVLGCDGSILLNSTRNNLAEKDMIPNQHLRGFQVIDAVKLAVEKKCPRKVSCADILALAARDAILQIKGPFWNVPLGRRDGRKSSAKQASANIPLPSFNITQLVTLFASKGLSTKDLVVLSGSHTIGICHCSWFTTRIYNFTGRGDADTTMNPNYVAALKRACQLNDKKTYVEMDPGSFRDFDNSYFRNVKKRKGLLQTDSALMNNAYTKRYIQSHSFYGFDNTFFDDFAVSMEKMGRIGVLTGTSGEVRKVCSFVN